MYDYYFVQTANFMPYCCQKHWIRYYDTVYERDGIFGQLKIPMKFSIKLNLKILGLLNCLHMIFLDCILRYRIIFFKINLLI